MNNKIDFEGLIEYGVQFAMSEISDSMGREFLSLKKLDNEFKNHVKNKFVKYRKSIKALNDFFEIFQEKKNIEIFKYDRVEPYSFYIKLLEKDVSGKLEISGSSDVTICPSKSTSTHFNIKRIYGTKTKEIDLRFFGYQKEDKIFENYIRDFLNKDENIKLSRNIRLFLEEFNKHVWKARQKQKNIMINMNTIETLMGIDLLKISNEEIDLVSLKSDVDIREEVAEFKNNHNLLIEKSNVSSKKIN